MSESEHHDDDIEHVSKSQLKRESHALQNLGVALTKLNNEQLELIPLEDNLHKAILEARSIKKREALRRHMQLIGKLMRHSDYEAVEKAYAQITESQKQEARQLHQVEYWRDHLLSDAKNIESFITKYPRCERQQLRQLVQAAHKEKSAGKPPSSARKLFKFLKQEMQQHLNNEDY